MKSKVAAKNGFDGRLIAKILITTIQMNLVPNRSETWRGNTVIKILAISLPSQPSLAATLDFTSFFTMAFLGATHFYYSWAVFGLD